MPKTKISRKQKGFSKEKSRALAYRAGDEVSLLGLKEAIVESLFEADFDTFKGCIAILLEKYDYREITRATGLSKSTLYRMCEPSSNPTMDNLGKVLKFIERQLQKAA